ncbi:MAG: hypothetical protein ACOYL8_04050 [Patescibacteria group bacterium]
MRKFVIATICLVIMLASLPFTVLATSAHEAKRILGTHFVSIKEAREVFPDIPSNIKIHFLSKTLKDNPDFWLLPIEINNRYEYVFVRANFCFEYLTAEQKRIADTLNLSEGKRVIYLLKKVRPTFQGMVGVNNNFRYFFRTKSESIYKCTYKNIFSCNEKKFLIIDWPNDIETGLINSTYASFITNIKGKEYIGFVPLPKLPHVNQKTDIEILTLFYLKAP